MYRYIKVYVDIYGIVSIHVYVYIYIKKYKWYIHVHNMYT